MATRKIKKNPEGDIITIAQAFKEFLEEKEANNVVADTLTNYEKTYKIFMETMEYDSSTPIEQITEGTIIHFINSLKLHKVGEDGLKIGSINQYLSNMRSFLYWCMGDMGSVHSKKGYIKNSFQIKLLKKQEEPFKIFTDEEIERLIVEPTKRDCYGDWRTWAIVNWVLATGNRAGTIRNVKLGDLDFKRKEIRLAHTKNKKLQIIPFDEALQPIIKKFIKMYRYDAALDDYLFANAITGEQLTHNALNLGFMRYCQAREVCHYNIHGLRHYFAKQWLQNNGDMFKLQKVLGHSTLEMTRRYVNYFTEDLKEGYEKYSPLSNMVRAKSKKHNVKRNVLFDE